MDFKYIEQLIERYFDAESTLEEEEILHRFFQQEDVPAHLRQWQPLFTATNELAAAHLDDSFDERILQLTGEVHVRARHITLVQRLRPLWRIAALVIVAAGIGITMQHSRFGLAGQSSPAPGQMAGTEAVPQDELDPAATTPLDLRADVLTTPADSDAVTTPYR